ncbi:MAG: hypothetical protein K2M46_01515 [Lachnospiraceae bacterium]|nr:hypothetical protein [Lachnospiraceae bacterium]
MKHKNIIRMVCTLAGASLLTGCVATPESSVVKQKGKTSIENYKEAESENSGIPLREALAVPENYQSQVTDDTGRLNIITDAVVEMPDVSNVSSIYVSQHPFDQEQMELITKAFFEDAEIYDADSYTKKTKDEWQEMIEELKGYEAAGNLDPYGWGTDENGNYVYNLSGQIEYYKQRYAQAPEKRELKKVEPPFELKKVEPSFDQENMVPGVNYDADIISHSGSYFYGIAMLPDNTCYRYDLAKTSSYPVNVYIKKVSDAKNLDTEEDLYWYDYFPQIMDEEEMKAEIGISQEEAQKIADEKVAKLNIPNMEVVDFQYVMKFNDYTDVAQREDINDVGYCFHYARKLNGIPITYTSTPGGFTEDEDSEMEPWSYEVLDVCVTKDGIDEVDFCNQYDIGEIKTKNLELLPFSEIQAIYEKMMVIQNAEMLVDQREAGDDMAAPPESITFHINRITFGYSRIYDPKAESRTGVLVPVWDFFGECERIYSGEDAGLQGSQRSQEENSVLTINAVDGTVIDRHLGY